MCLIIHQRSGYTLPQSQLKTIYARNSDGFGVMFSENSKLYTLRFVGTLDETMRAYYLYAAGRECLIHWRLSTAGRIDVHNAHPFVLGDSQIGMMHNGIVGIGQPYNTMSDTYHLAEYILKPIAQHDPEHVMSEDFCEVLSGLVGYGNRLAFMNHKGQVSICNREEGVEYEGNWFSNTYAWNVPNHLRPKANYSRTVYDPLTKTWSASPNYFKDCEAEAEVEVETVTVSDYSAKDYDLEDLKKLIVEEGEAGAAKWAREYPDFARKLIHDWYDIDIGNVSTFTLVDFLLEIAGVEPREEVKTSTKPVVKLPLASTSTALTLIHSDR